ncbi:hypothetical protein [Microcystis aeruginosa]|uniref:hypothetical protein n=1 Tax=Microcystis aeruginosa TaxID=1126 RepID=UPI001882F5DA|nr:hypothetical protein [Microcystis aeruginosa]MBE8996159.1 hypothetical protein [Microcystis aeruginosa LEGE 91341]
MTTKAEYRERFESHPRPNQETQKVINYFGNDDKYWYINSFDCKSFLGQAAHFMGDIAIEENGNLEAILAKTREVLEPLCPPNLADFDSVDWEYVGLDYLWGELFDFINERD